MPIRKQTPEPHNRPDIRFYGIDGASGFSNMATDLGQYETDLTTNAGRVAYEASPASRLSGLTPRTIALHVTNVGTAAYLYSHGTSGEDQLQYSGSQYNVGINGANAVVLSDPGGTELIIVVRTEANPATTGASDALMTTLEIFDRTNGTMHRATGTHVAIPNPTADFAFWAQDAATTGSWITAGGAGDKIRVSARAVSFTEIAQDWLERDGLVMELESATLFDEISNQTATADGTTYDEPTDSRDFDGATDRIDLAAIADPSSSPFTCDCWLNPDEIGTGLRSILNIANAGGSQQFIFRRDLGRLDFTILHTVTHLRRLSGTVLTAGQWHHVAVTHDGSSAAASCTLYVDGEEVPSYTTTTNGAGSPVAADGTWSIGGRLSTDTNNFDGKIAARMRAWLRELSAAEIKRLASHPRPFLNDAKLQRQGMQLTEASGVGDQAEIHGAAVQWAAAELRHAQWRTMGALANWRFQNAPTINESRQTDADYRQKIRLAPSSTLYRLYLGWLGIFPVAPTCNALWCEIHARAWNFTDASLNNQGLRVYSFDSRKPSTADFRFAEVTFALDEAAPGTWKIAGKVPVVRSNSGATYLCLAYAIDLDESSDLMRLEVYAMHAVQIFDETFGAPPGGGPLGEAG